MYRVLAEPVSRTAGAGLEGRMPTSIQPAPLTMLLGEGDLVDLGDRRFRVLHLPGHSPDSIGLLDERDGLFFSGDAIYDDTLIDDLPDSDRDRLSRHHGPHHRPAGADRLWRPWRELFGRAHA